jgi:hypothetical protein
MSDTGQLHQFNDESLGGFAVLASSSLSVLNETLSSPSRRQ